MEAVFPNGHQRGKFYKKTLYLIVNGTFEFKTGLYLYQMRYVSEYLQKNQKQMLSNTNANTNLY